MNKLALLVLVAVVLPSAIATPTHDLQWLKVYVDGDKLDDADENGGEIVAEPGQTIKFKWWIENPQPRTSDYEVNIRIFDVDNGDDIVEEENSELSSEDDEIAYLDIQIPSTTDEDVYDVTVRIRSDDGYNTTEENIDFDLVIEEPSFGESIGGDVGLLQQCINATSIAMEGVGILSKTLNTTGSWYKQYLECNKEVGTYLERVDHLNSTEAELSQCKTDLETLQQNQATCSAEKGTMYTFEEYTDAIAEAVDKQKSQAYGLVAAAGILGFIGYHWKKKKDEEREKPPGKRMPGTYP